MIHKSKPLPPSLPLSANLICPLERLQIKKRDQRNLNNRPKATHRQIVQVRRKKEEAEEDGQAGRDVTQRGTSTVLCVQGGTAERAGAGKTEEEARDEVGGADGHLWWWRKQGREGGMVLER